MMFSKPSSTTFVITALAAALLGARNVLAGVYITNPVASTQVTGGQSLTVQWQDDGSSPLLSAVGPSRIDLYTGSTNQQTFLQSFADSVDVSKVNSVTGLIPTSTGPDGDWYFIRVTSAALKANATGAGGITYPYEAFSAKFTLNGMSGQFNASVSSQNAAAASTGFGGSTAPAAAAASSTASGMTTTSTPKALAGASSSSSSSVSGTASKTGSASGSGASAASASQSSGAQRGLVASGLFVALFSCGLAVIL